ncbi:MAG: 4'-phosphopantetheinyl transferase superfamily protein [Polaromonas sp.]
MTAQRSSDPAPIAVHPWPASRPQLAAAAGLDLIVISVATPDSAPRPAAREQLRGAVRELLGLQLECAPAAIKLLSIPGQAPRLDLPRLPGHSIGLSASHDAGISVAAIHRCGPVGIDILRITQRFDWQPVARDYLGIKALERIAGLPQLEQMPAFAREWTRLEAALKCLGLGLQEWSAALEARMGACHLTALELPAGLFGAVARRR